MKVIITIRPLLLLTGILATLSIPTASMAASVTPEMQQVKGAKLHIFASNSSNQSENVLQLMQQGIQLYQAEQFSESVKVLKQAVKVLHVQRDVLNEAQTLNYLSLAYQELGQLSPATEAIAQSLQLLQPESKQGNSTDYLLVKAQALNTQGHLQLALGQPEKALNSWQQASTTYASSGDRAGAIGSQINAAQALRALGLYRRALTTLTEVKLELAKQPDSPIKATGLRSLGNVLRVVGDLKQSAEVLQESLAVALRLRSPQTAALISLGNTARASGNATEAKTYYQQAETTSNSPTLKIQAQLNQLSLLLEQQQWSEAQEIVPKIQSQLASLPTSRAAVYSQINLAQSLMCLKHQGLSQIEIERSSPILQLCYTHEKQISKVKAHSTLDSASSTESVPTWTEIGQLLASAVQQSRTLQDPRAEAYALGYLGGLYQQTQQLSTAQDLTQKALIKAEAIDAPDIAYRWQWQLGRLLKTKGQNTEAIAPLTKAVNTLKSLRSDLVAINPDVQFSFRDSVEPVYRELVSLLLESEGTSQPSQKNLVQARDVIESLQLAELENFFRAACLQAKPVQIDQIIDKDAPTAAVIYPIILADRLEVIVKLPSQPLLHYKASIKQSEAEKIIETLRQKIIKPYTLRETRSLSKQVYDWLIRPAEADLAKSNVKTLVFVLDGSLRNIPMAALYDGQQYLVQKYGIALTPGLQLLAPKSLSRGNFQALTAGLSESRQGFSALTNVALELQQIKSQVPTTVLLNQEFTDTTLQKEINSVPFPVVHLATHGQFSSKAEETFILTWDDRINVNELSNLLRVRDTSKPNAIELLVLSACQTAAGDKRAALGLAGVAVRAGARSTLASLWNVDDESTAQLMSQFYRELGNNHLSKAEALRQAQLVLLKNPKYQHPLFWAPYVLVGNWL